MLQINTENGEGRVFKSDFNKNIELHRWNIHNPKNYNRVKIKSPHFHLEYQIGYITNGVIENKYRKENNIITPKQLYIIQPGEIHTEYLIGKNNLTFNFVFIPGNLLQQAACDILKEEDQIRLSKELLVGNKPLNRLLVHKLQSALIKHQGAATPLEKEESLVDFVSTLIKNPSRPARENGVEESRKTIKKLKDYLCENLYNDISLDTLSSAVFVSKFHLGRIFLKETGITIHRYLLHLKLCKAKELLIKGYSINDVALQLGFTDKAHFTKRFKQFTSQTPGQFCRS